MGGGASDAATTAKVFAARTRYPPSTVRNRRANGAAGASYAGTGPDSCDLSSLMERVPRGAGWGGAGDSLDRGESPVDHYLSNAGVLQKWRIM